MADMSAGKLVGIDLGTTFSAIATLDDHGQAVTLPNRDGEMLTPSAVLIEDGSAVVGQAARDVALDMPDRVAMLIKRSMGQQKFEHPVSGRDFCPETLSAIILRKLVQDAELRIGPVSKAVITVPAYFDDTRRKATKDAGSIAGLDVIDILDEPTAAALRVPGHRGRRPPGRQGLGRPHRRSRRRPIRTAARQRPAAGSHRPGLAERRRRARQAHAQQVEPGHRHLHPRRQGAERAADARRA